MSDLFVSQSYALEDNFGGRVTLSVDHEERKVIMTSSDKVRITKDMFDQFRHALDLAENDLKKGGWIDV